MRVLVQRVTSSSVEIGGTVHAAIGAGLLLLVGIGREDGPEDVAKLARKLANLRIFADTAGKMNLSVKDSGGEVLAVSQFTLYADCSRGNRPGFEPAAPPAQAEALYQDFLEQLRQQGLAVKSGVFQADMLVRIANDGPVTIMLES